MKCGPNYSKVTRAITHPEQSGTVKELMEAREVFVKIETAAEEGIEAIDAMLKLLGEMKT